MPGHGERRLGDVGGEHDPPAPVRAEDAVLLGGGQPGVERQDLDVRPGPAAWRSASAVSRISRSPGRNTRTSPGPSAHQLVDGVADGLGLVPVVVVVLVVGHGR